MLKLKAYLFSMYQKYKHLQEDEIKEIEEICKNSTFIPAQIEENNSEPFDEKVIMDNMDDKEFHLRFKAKLDELNQKYKKYESNDIK